jgi:large subunit ribosomal protein L25
VTYVNADQSQDLKRGSYVIRINQFVEVLCEDADAVPESLVVDLSTAQKGDVIRLRDIALPAKIRPFKSTAGEDVLCVVKSARSK